MSLRRPGRSRPWRSSRQVLASEAQAHLAGGMAEGAHSRQANSLGSSGWSSYLPPFLPSCLSAATSSSLSPLYFPLGHVNNVSLHSQVHTQLKKGGKCMCDTLRFSHRDRSGGKCATLDEPIRCVGIPEYISNSWTRTLLPLKLRALHKYFMFFLSTPAGKGSNSTRSIFPKGEMKYPDLRFQA